VARNRSDIKRFEHMVWIDERAVTLRRRERRMSIYWVIKRFQSRHVGRTCLDAFAERFTE
jgi:hypothetical protein